MVNLYVVHIKNPRKKIIDLTELCHGNATNTRVVQTVEKYRSNRQGLANPVHR